MIPRCNCIPRRRQRGQAMAEIIIALLMVLIPLFVFGWAISGYLTTRNLALSGARYSAWERTVWFDKAPTDSPLTGNKKVEKPQSRIQDEMLRRVFVKDSGDGGIRTQPTGAMPRNDDAPESTRTYHIDGRKLLELDRTGGATGAQGSRPSLRLADTGASTSTGVATLLNDMSKLTSSLRGAKPLDLEGRGIWRADVSVRPNALDISMLGDGRQRTLPEVTFKESVAVMADPWNVGGAEHEVSRVEPLVPTSILDMPAVDTVRNIVGFLVPPLRDWQPGYVDADRLPQDRRK